MTVSIAFAVIGGVILIGFFANLLFRLTKIPSVLLLIAIGVILGPATGWIPTASLIEVAPYFGTIALLIILFEGGLELDIRSVVQQAPRAALLAVLVFVFSVGMVFLFAFFTLKMAMATSLMIAAIFGASSPAICLPVVSGLSVRKETQTILKLESALGDVLLIVSVLLILDFQVAGSQSTSGMISRFLMSFLVALVIASIAGGLWSRLIGWMKGEPLAYMLTLGFVFLLYFTVEELGGNAAIAVLLFGIMLENMHVVADRASVRVRTLFGIDIRAEQFVLHEFMKNITEELSFLIRTFFFVYLGLILNFSSITPRIALSSLGIVVLLFAGRWIGVLSIRKRSRFSAGETQAVLAMLPRGLATAVMAFLPLQYGVGGMEMLPTYAFAVIVLTNILMTGGILLAERRLAREKTSPASVQDIAPTTAVEAGSREISEEDVASAATTIDEISNGTGATPPHAVVAAHETEAPFSFANSMSKLFGIRKEDREWRCIEAIKTASLADPQFWLMVFFAAALTILGLVLNQSAIIIGAALLVPIAWPVVAAGLALTVGDVYLFLKLLLKLALAAVLTAALAASFSGLLPFSAFTAEIASRARATILDFLVAFFAGMAGASMLFSKRRILPFLPGAVLGITLLPSLAIMGLGLGSGLNMEIFRGGAVLFTANFFAAILGASLVYALVGMPAIAELDVIRDWKRRELNSPFVNQMFGRLRLKNIAGRTGSVRSRLIVAAVFLLALVIPLQMAFNQLALEFRARQAISEVAKMFELPGRSAIINSASTIGEDAVAVRIQVATNAFFTAQDIRRFEERVSDRTGKTARLDLVQSLGEIGEGQTVRGMLRPSIPAPAEYSASIPEIAVRLRDEMEKNLRLAPLPGSIAFLRASTELSLSGQPSIFLIEYLAEAPLSEDAVSVLANLLERQMKLEPGSLRLVHIPSLYSFRLNLRESISTEEQAQLEEIQYELGQNPQLHATVTLAGSGSDKEAERLLKELCASAPSLSDPARTTVSSSQSQERRTSTVRLRPAASPADKAR